MNLGTAILATGDEIVQGDTLNTNARDIAHRLFTLGVPLGMRMVTTDDEAHMRDAMTILLERHDNLIITGGLGPTSDDRTRFALADYLQTDLVLDQETWDFIQARHHDHGIKTVDIAKQQAMFPRDATIFAETLGTAKGCRVKHNNKTIYMLPGPPRELLPMFETYVLPDFKQRYAGEVVILRWRVFGVPESLLGEKIDAMMANYDAVVSYRWFYPYTDVKVRVNSAAQIPTIQQLLDDYLQRYIICPALQTASEVLRERFCTDGDVIRINDQATQGFLASELSDPKNHHRLRFVSDDDADVLITGLDEFWQSKTDCKETSVTLTIKGQLPATFTMPFRHKYIREYARELIAGRLLCGLP